MTSFDAESLLNQINDQAAKVATMDDGLERGFAHLGYLLLEVSEMQYWRVQFDTFRDYLKDLSPKARRSVGQLQQYFLTVRDLTDMFTETELETMGITKAIKLRQIRDYAIVLPPHVVDAALDPKVTVAEMKKIASKALKAPEDGEEADWMDCEMEFVVSPEERATIAMAIDSAMRTEPVIKETIAKSAQLKEVMLRLCMEWMNTYGAADGQ